MDIRFRGSISSVLVNPEYCELLYYSGCREIGIGFESADDNILKIVNKAGNATTNMHANAVKMIQKSGMQAKIYIITGLPGETEESIKAIKRFVIDLKPDKYIVSLFTPYPGTPIFNNPKFYGAEILHKRWREYDGDWPAVSVVNIDGVTHDVFEKRFEDLTVWLRTHDKESFTKGLSEVHDHYEYSSMY